MSGTKTDPLGIVTSEVLRHIRLSGAPLGFLSELCDAADELRSAREEIERLKKALAQPIAEAQHPDDTNEGYGEDDNSWVVVVCDQVISYYAMAEEAKELAASINDAFAMRQGQA